MQPTIQASRNGLPSTAVRPHMPERAGRYADAALTAPAHCCNNRVPHGYGRDRG